MGLLARETNKILELNPGLVKVLGSADRPEDLMTAMAATLTAVLASALGVQAVTRMSAEETSGRLGLALSARYGRARWWASVLVVLTIETLAVLVTGALGYDVGARLTGLDTGTGRNLTAFVSYLPAVLLILLVGTFLLALSPRIAAVARLGVLWPAVVALLAETLRLPTWSQNLSPLHLVGRVPVEAMDSVAALGMAACALGLGLLSITLIGRRDLAAG